MPAERRKGMDHDHYAFSALPHRPPLRWPHEARVALAIIVALEYLELDPPPGSRTASDLAGGLGPRPHPNYALLSHREYGHRVGVFRVLDALARYGVRPTVALDARTAEEYPFLVRHCLERHAEIVAHGISVSRMVNSAMSEDEERDYIAETLRRLREATGVEPRGWLGPEYGESERTPRLLAEAGVRYVCDWGNDEQPYAMTTPSGELYGVPTMVDFDDAFALWSRRIPPQRYGAMLREGFDVLHRDGAESARALVFTVRPWLIGQPFRIGVLEDALEHMMRSGGVWAATTGEIADAYRARS